MLLLSSVVVGVSEWSSARQRIPSQPAGQVRVILALLSNLQNAQYSPQISGGAIARHGKRRVDRLWLDVLDRSAQRQSIAWLRKSSITVLVETA
jgi:hypothetical protein